MENRSTATPTLLTLCLDHIWKAVLKDADVLKALPIELAERLVRHMLARLRIINSPPSPPPDDADDADDSRRCTLRIQLGGGCGRVMTFRAKMDWPVCVAVAEVHRRARDSDQSLHEDPRAYAFFRVLPGVQTGGRWLGPPAAPLRDLDLKPWECVQLRPRRTPLKVQFFGPWERVVHPQRLSTLEATLKTFPVDGSLPVRDVAASIAEKLAIPDAAEFGLRLASVDSAAPSPQQQQLQQPYLLQQQHQQMQQQSAQRWLNRDQTLADQGIDPLHAVFTLRRQFYLTTDTLRNMESPEALHLGFCECLDAISGELFPCGREQACVCAALVAQICLGDYSPGSPFLWRAAEFLPPEYADSPGATERVFAHWKGLSGVTEDAAKRNYVELCLSLPTLGHTFFKVLTTGGPLPPPNPFERPRPFLFGVSPQSITLLQADTKDRVWRVSLQDLRKWNVFGSQLVLHLNEDDIRHEFFSSEAEAISQVLSGCVSFNLRDTPELQRLWTSGYNTIVNNPRLSLPVSRHLSIGSAASGDTATAVYHKCRLYDEPRRHFYNPIFRGAQTTLGPIAAACETKRRRLLKLIKLIAHLSRKWPTPVFPSVTSADPSVPAAVRTARPISVRLANRKSVSIMVFDDSTVAEATRLVASTIGITVGIDEFSLLLPPSTERPRDEEPQWLPPHLSLSAALTLQQSRQRLLKKRRSIGLPGSPFSVAPEAAAAVPAQASGQRGSVGELRGAAEPPTLLFRKKFWWGDAAIMDDCTLDPVHFNLLFYQWREEVITNPWRTTFEEALKLAATLFQISFGDHNPEIHRVGFLRSPEDLHFFMASEHVASLPFSKLEPRLYKEHAALRGIKEAFAKYRFVSLCRALKSYGTSFFRVRVTAQSPEMQLGFSRAAICMLDPRTKDIVSETPITRLRKWSTDDQLGTVTLDFGDYLEGSVSYLCADPMGIGDFLSDFTDFVMRRNLCKTVRSYSLPGDTFLLL